MKPELKRPVSVEDLIRLKRTERPATEFWSRFDRELRTKQLAALVEKRPWWRDFAGPFSGLARFGLPVGATAILAFSFLALRDSPPSGSVPAARIGAEGPSAMGSIPVAAEDFTERARVPAALAVAPSALPAVEVAAAVTDEPSASVAAPSAALSRHGSAIGFVAAPNSAFTVSALEARLPSTIPSASESVIARNLLGATRGFEGRAMPVRPTVEPLQQMMTPRDVRRAKMLTAMVSISNETPAPNAERVARNLPDERLYDQINRFSGRGDRLSVKF